MLGANALYSLREKRAANKVLEKQNAQIVNQKKEIEEICDDESTAYVFGVDDDFREIVPRLSNKHVCADTSNKYKHVPLF